MANTTKNRGHWTLGKSRNNPACPKEWTSVVDLIAAVNAHIKAHADQGESGAPSPASKHTIAEELGLPLSSLRGYLSGLSMPPTEVAQALADWLESRRKWRRPMTRAEFIECY